MFGFFRVECEPDENENRHIWERLSKLETHQQQLSERLIAIELRSGIYRDGLQRGSH
jgi:hypothetical protein